MQQPNHFSSLLPYSLGFEPVVAHQTFWPTSAGECQMYLVAVHSTNDHSLRRHSYDNMHQTGNAFDDDSLPDGCLVMSVPLT